MLAVLILIYRTKTVAAAQADAEKIKVSSNQISTKVKTGHLTFADPGIFFSIIQKVGAAEAAAIEAIGKAEAERMRQKAAAYKQYGDAAMMSLILESLPKVSPLNLPVIYIYIYRISSIYPLF